jgi:hypothetical protein
MNFSITYNNTDTLNNAMDSAKLQKEFSDSSVIGDVIHHVQKNFDATFTVYFDRNLTSEEAQESNSIVQNHDGFPLPKEPETVSVRELSTLQTDNAGNPKYVFIKEVGDYNTIPTHNFCVDDSIFTLKPNAGDKLFLNRSEIQLEHDLNLTPTRNVDFKYYAWVPLDAANGDFTPVEHSVQDIYFNDVRDLFLIGNAHFTADPIGTMQNKLTTIKFEQETDLVFYSNPVLGQLSKAEIHIGGGQPLEGSYVTVSFITKSEAQE